MDLDRRTFFKLSGATALVASLPACSRSNQSRGSQPVAPDYTIRIAAGLVEVAPNRVIATTLYNDQFPGPLIRLREGRPVVIDVHNDTDIPEQLHWHGQMLPADIDGTTEEGTPFIPARGHRRLSFMPGPSGLRFYHTHGFAGSDLRAGLYGGQVGLGTSSLKGDLGAYDQEVFLVLKEFSPSLTHLDDMIKSFLAPAERDKTLETIGETAYMTSLAQGMPHGFEVEYADPTINGRSLSYSDPIRVKSK